MSAIETASQALKQIMLAESSEEWEPYGHKAARISLPDGSKLVVSEQRIAEAAREIELGDVHPDLDRA